jgi:PEP-CTERM motif
MSCGSPKTRPTKIMGLGLVLVVLGCAQAPRAEAGIVISPSGTGSFGPNGDVGFVNSPPNLTISFGADGQGQIAQMDGFINVAGENLNNSGSGFGTSAQLTYGPPAGLAYTFGADQPNSDQLYLSYEFTNHTGANLSGFQFISYVNPYFGSTVPDDYATVTGTTSSTPTVGPASYQVGDANNSSIFTNVNFGTLDNTNGTTNPPTGGINVAMAIGFSVANLAINQAIVFEVLLSDNGTSIGSLAITDLNPNYPGDMLTVSGMSVPEPSTIALLGLGSIGAFAWVTASRRKRVRRGAPHSA